MATDQHRTYLTYHGYTIRKAQYSEEELDAIRKDLTVEPKVHPDFKGFDIARFAVYKENAAKMYLPRYYGVEKLGAPETIDLSLGEAIDIPFSGNLRPIQEPIASKVLETLRTKGGGTLVVNPAMGKTVMAIYLVCQLGRKALIVCHKDFLINQWIERINEFAPSAKIGVIKGTKTITDGRDIVIASIQTLWAKELPESIMKTFGFVVYDEAHHVSARQFHKSLQKTCFNYTLALTATPERGDGLEAVCFWYLGPICYRQELKDKPKETVLVRSYEYVNHHPDYCKMEFNVMRKPNNSKMISNIADCIKRSQFIASLIPPLLEEGRKIIMLTERISQVDWFMTELPKMGVDCGRYVGGMKQAALDAAQSKRVLISSFQMVLEGFDNSTLDTLIWCTPKAGAGGLEQGIGRILRKQAHLRTHVPLVIDIADMFGMYRLKAFQRRQFYRKHGYQLQILQVDDNRDQPIITGVAALVSSNTTTLDAEEEEEDIEEAPKFKFDDE